MKRFTQSLIVVCCFVCIATSAFAQKGWQIGLRVTPQMSWNIGDGGDADKDSIYKAEKTYGVNFGVAVGYNFSKYMGVMVNALYSSQGQDHSSWYVQQGAEGMDTVKVLTELRTRYVKIPFLFKINTNSERKFSASLEIGPQLGFLTTIDERSTDTRNTHLPADRPLGIDYATETVTNFPSRPNTFNRVAFMGVVGLGVDIKLRFNLKMNLQARMDYAFTDLEKKGATYNVTKDGNTRTEDYYYSPNNRNYYNANRGSIQAMTVGLTIGFTYSFIPKLHF